MPWTFDTDTASALVGTRAVVDLVVSDADTASRAGSGDLDVLATPRVVALVEEAACAALAGSLPPTVTSVGTRIDIRHRAPSAVGAVVRGIAVITHVDATRVQFDVSTVEDPDGRALVVADGAHTRVVVDRAAFLKALTDRA